jgi:membrane-associated phospholipid phosphatase
MPFLFCIAIYTNMHDTIGFINPHNIDKELISIDQYLFGVQPSVWMQKFYNPILTDILSLSYMNYFLLVVTVVIYLLIKGKEKEMRITLLGTILTFYFGYFLYILFPASSPSITLAHMFTRDLSGGWLTHVQKQMLELDPTAARAAFPSLHNAVTLITLMYAYKNSKILFWILLLPGIVLVFSTVYLRHHYVIDLFAGYILAIAVYYATPKIDIWWNNVCRRFKYYSSSST